MDSSLIDREILGNIIDELMKKRPIPVDTTAELEEFRESAMQRLNDHIFQAIYDSLDDAQVTELNRLLDRESSDPNVFRDFFLTHGINIEEIVADALASFSASFLTEGGQNA